MEVERIQERLTKIETILYGIEQSNLNPHAQNQSYTINEIATAFSKAQAEFGRIEQNRSNPFFKSKYADLDAILKAVRPALSKHGLSFYQYESIKNGETILHSRIMHSSGQWIESQTKINPPKGDIQSFGSTMSYKKRYSALTILGVATSDDPSDDDGNSVSQKNPPKSTITPTQVKKISTEIKGKEFLEPVIMKKLKIEKWTDMLQSDFDTVMNIIKKYEEKA